MQRRGDGEGFVLVDLRWSIGTSCCDDIQTFGIRRGGYMNWSEIISDPAVGNFLLAIIGLAFIWLNEKRKSSARTEDRHKYCSCIISQDGEIRKVWG